MKYCSQLEASSKYLKIVNSHWLDSVLQSDFLVSKLPMCKSKVNTLLVMPYRISFSGLLSIKLVTASMCAKDMLGVSIAFLAHQTSKR